MEDKRLGRREFLKLAIASAAATGLTHFQFLNIAAQEAIPQEICDADECVPGQVPDICQPQPGGSVDVCAPNAVPTEPDLCYIAAGVTYPDMCDPGVGDVDVCSPAVSPPDECVSTGDQDFCDGGQDSTDICAAGQDLQDTCPDPGAQGSEGDACLIGYPDPDWCHDGQPDNDICDPAAGEPDVTPTAVTLSGLSTSRTDEGMKVEWQTATEIDNLGFNVYRATSADGEWAKLNGALIPAQAPGSPEGGAYRFMDRTVRQGATYYYWLEDVDIYGHATYHGPITARVGFRDIPLFNLKP